MFASMGQVFAMIGEWMESSCLEIVGVGQLLSVLEIWVISYGQIIWEEGLRSLGEMAVDWISFRVGLHID